MGQRRQQSKENRLQHIPRAPVGLSDASNPGDHSLARSGFAAKVRVIWRTTSLIAARGSWAFSDVLPRLGFCRSIALYGVDSRFTIGLSVQP